MKKLFLLLTMFLIYAGVSAQTNPTFNQVRLNKLKAITDSLINVEGSLVPLYDSAFNLGNDTNRWDTGYFDVIDANVIDGVTYPDSSVVYIGSDGKFATDSSDFAWTGLNLRIKNVQYAPNAGALCIMAPSYSESHIMHRVSNDGASHPASHRFQRSRGTLAAPTAVIMGSQIGRISWAGYNGTDFVSASLSGVNYGIEGVSAGTWSGDVQPVYTRITSSGFSQNGHSYYFTHAGTFSIGSTSAFTDTLYTLSVLGTARISITPASTSGTDSILMKAGTGQVMAMPFAEGVYLPVDSAGSNVDGVTPDTAFYTRVGNIVTVSGVVEIDPTTTATPTFFYMNVPVFPLNWNTNRAGGTFASYIVNESGAVIMGGPTSVLFQFNPTATGANIFSYTYSYRIQ